MNSKIVFTLNIITLSYASPAPKPEPQFVVTPMMMGGVNYMGGMKEYMGAMKDYMGGMKGMDFMGRSMKDMKW